MTLLELGALEPGDIIWRPYAGGHPMETFVFRARIRMWGAIASSGFEDLVVYHRPGNPGKVFGRRVEDFLRVFCLPRSDEEANRGES